MSAAVDPDIQARIKALGRSKVNPDVEKAMMGEKGKRPVCETCGQEIEDDTVRAEMMDRGVLR